MSGRQKSYKLHVPVRDVLLFWTWKGSFMIQKHFLTGPCVSIPCANARAPHQCCHLHVNACCIPGCQCLFIPGCQCLWYSSVSMPIVFLNASAFCICSGDLYEPGALAGPYLAPASFYQQAMVGYSCHTVSFFVFVLWHTVRCFVFVGCLFVVVVLGSKRDGVCL